VADSTLIIAAPTRVKRKVEFQHVNARIDRLLDVYLDGALEEAEFKRKKNALMEAKATIEQRIDDFERRGEAAGSSKETLYLLWRRLEDTIRTICWRCMSSWRS